MPESTEVILAALFLLVAFLYSTVGHAGASGYLAVMALVGVSDAIWKPTSFSLNILVATVTTIQFARAGHFSWRLFWPFALLSIPAAFLGGKILLPTHVFKIVIGAVLLFSAWRLALTGPRTAPARTRPPPVPFAIGVGAVLGFVAGLTGTGGGIFLSPLMLLCGWADTKRTAAASAVFILVNSVSGLAGLYSRFGTLPPAIPLWGGAVVAGGLFGSQLGSRILGGRTLRRLLAVVLVMAGAKLIFGLGDPVPKPPPPLPLSDHAP